MRERPATAVVVALPLTAYGLALILSASRLLWTIRASNKPANMLRQTTKCWRKQFVRFNRGKTEEIEIKRDKTVCSTVPAPEIRRCWRYKWRLERRFHAGEGKISKKDEKKWKRRHKSVDKKPHFWDNRFIGWRDKEAEATQEKQIKFKKIAKKGWQEDRIRR